MDKYTLFTAAFLTALIGAGSVQSQAGSTRTSRAYVAFGVRNTGTIGTYRNPREQAALREKYGIGRPVQQPRLLAGDSLPPASMSPLPALSVWPQSTTATGGALPTQLPLASVAPPAEAGISPEKREEGGRVPMIPDIPIYESNVIGSRYVELPFNKTVSIIFDSPVRSVDLGSRDLMADRADGVENVLKVKAAKMGFNETNFSVITADGKFHSFVANYNEQPPLLALNLATTVTKMGDQLSMNARRKYIDNQNEGSGFIQFENVRASQSDVVFSCAEILKKRRSVRHLGVQKDQMEATVRGVFVRDNVIYFKLGIRNKSNLHYDIDQIRFFVVDETVAKRTSRQELEMQPFYVHNDAIKTVRGGGEVERVVAFQKFTIPDNQRIQVVMGEIDGGRNLSFMVSNADLIQADTL